MIRRAVRLGAASAALLLAASQARSWWAEQAYEAGNFAVDPASGEPATAHPDRDVPGRLENYLVAAARDATQPAYGLHAAQILLHRATRKPQPTDAAAQLARARSLVEAAVARGPLNSEAHLVLAHALIAGGDPERAVLHLRTVIATGRRRMSTLEPATSLLVHTWRRSHDPDLLVDILTAASLGLELADGRDRSLPPLGRVFVASGVSAFLTSSSGPTIDDLRLALRGRPDLAETAARLVEKQRPDDARALRAGGPTERRP